MKKNVDVKKRYNYKLYIEMFLFSLFLLCKCKTVLLVSLSSLFCMFDLQGIGVLFLCVLSADEHVAGVFHISQTC